MRRRLGAKFHWLPDMSGCYSNTYSANVAANGSSATYFQDLLPGPDRDPELSEGLNFPRMAAPNTIIRTIEGQVHWAIYPASDSPTGMWGVFIRMAIFPFGSETPYNAGVGSMGTPQNVLVEQIGTTNPYEMSPVGSGGANFLQHGSRAIRKPWWRRTFAFPAISMPVTINSDLLTPPGSYIKLRPNKLLRQRERLLLCVQFTTVNVNTALNHIAVGFSPDLRIAGRPTTRRA